MKLELPKWPPNEVHYESCTAKYKMGYPGYSHCPECGSCYEKKWFGLKRTKQCLNSKSECSRGMEK